MLEALSVSVWQALSMFHRGSGRYNQSTNRLSCFFRTRIQNEVSESEESGRDCAEAGLSESDYAAHKINDSDPALERAARDADLHPDKVTYGIGGGFPVTDRHRQQDASQKGHDVGDTGRQTGETEGDLDLFRQDEKQKAEQKKQNGIEGKENAERSHDQKSVCHDAPKLGDKIRMHVIPSRSRWRGTSQLQIALLGRKKHSTPVARSLGALRQPRDDRQCCLNALRTRRCLRRYKGFRRRVRREDAGAIRPEKICAWPPRFCSILRA
jgi:hypothetical protein